MYECRLCYQEISLLNRVRGYEFCSEFHAVVFLARVRAGMSGSLPIDVEHIKGPAVLDASAVLHSSRPSPAPPANTDEEKDLLRAIALKQLFFQEPEPYPPSRTRTAVLAGAIVSALALMVFVAPFRKSAMPLSPVAADAAKAAMQERGASSQDVVIQVGSAVPPARDTVSDQAVHKNADKGRDEPPVSEPKSEGREAVITASSEADLAARPLPSPVPK